MKSLIRSVAYKALDLATGGRGVRRVIGGETFRMPARWSRCYAVDYEPATFSFLREWCRPGDTVLDLGAHIGLFTVFMSRLVGPRGRVLSFEPTPYTCEVLRETIRLNLCESNVEVHQKAVAKKTGCVTFYEWYHDTGEAALNANSLVRTRESSRAEDPRYNGLRSESEISVETVSIDELISPGETVRLLKIDVEGAEVDVLRGAGRTFVSSQPAVNLALHPLQIREAGETLEEVWDLLRDYRMVILHNHKPVDKLWFCDHDDLFDVQALPSASTTRSP